MNKIEEDNFNEKEEKLDLNESGSETEEIVTDESLNSPVLEDNLKKVLAEQKSRLKKTSFAEFLEKNEQLVGFETPYRTLVTAVKEIIENSIDACESANILPKIKIELRKVKGKYYHLVIQDNGPGIYYEKLGGVFGSFLYGSKFGSNIQSRGHQGIGASAITLHSQKKTGKLLTILSKTSDQEKAIKLKLNINIKQNKPNIVFKKLVDCPVKHGVKVGVYLHGIYLAQGKNSLPEFLKLTAMINPHVSIYYSGPDKSKLIFNRVTKEIPIRSEYTPPLPVGFEIGTLTRSFSEYEGTLDKFLSEEVYGLNEDYRKQIYKKSAINPDFYCSSLTIGEVYSLLSLLKRIEITPSSKSLSLLSQELILLGLTERLPYSFTASAVSEPKVYRSSPYVVEGALIFDSEGPKDSKISVIRVANKVPLIYNTAVCMITNQVMQFNWKNSGLSQSENDLPTGPVTLLLHLAMPGIPYISEAKDAVSNVEELKSAFKEVMEKLSKKLSKFIKIEKNRHKRDEQQKIIDRIIPSIAEESAKYLGLETPDINKINLLSSQILASAYILLEKVEEKVIVKLYNGTKHEYAIKVSCGTEFNEEVILSCKGFEILELPFIPKTRYIFRDLRDQNCVVISRDRVIKL